MNRKEPLFRVVKRESSSPVRQALAYVAAVVIALLIGAALLSSMDVDPLTFYQKMVTMGIPGNKFPWRIVENFVKLFVPLLITSLALSLAFRMRFWNIGGEGQFIMGAICAAAAAHKLGPVLPQPLVVLVMALCGILGGGLALSGYLLQTFFHNPIAGPFTLGISSGANFLGAVLQNRQPGRQVATVFADDSKKYLTTLLSTPPAETSGMVTSRIELLGYEPVETR